jgi:hypothetical protein
MQHHSQRLSRATVMMDVAAICKKIVGLKQQACILYSSPVPRSPVPPSFPFPRLRRQPLSLGLTPSGVALLPTSHIELVLGLSQRVCPHSSRLACASALCVMCCFKIIHVNVRRKKNLLCDGGPAAPAALRAHCGGRGR